MSQTERLIKFSVNTKYQRINNTTINQRNDQPRQKQIHTEKKNNKNIRRKLIREEKKRTRSSDTKGKSQNVRRKHKGSEYTNWKKGRMNNNLTQFLRVKEKEQ